VGERPLDLGQGVLGGHASTLEGRSNRFRELHGSRE
jgi:hypothetical protein